MEGDLNHEVRRVDFQDDVNTTTLAKMKETMRVLFADKIAAVFGGSRPDSVDFFVKVADTVPVARVLHVTHTKGAEISTDDQLKLVIVSTAAKSLPTQLIMGTPRIALAASSWLSSPQTPGVSPFSMPPLTLDLC